MIRHIAILFSTVLVLLVLSPDSKALVAKKINYGETVYSILRKHKFSMKLVNQALQKNILPDSFSLIPGNSYYISKKNNEFNIKFFDNSLDMAYEFWRQADRAGSRTSDANFNTKVRTVNGRVYGSLIASITKKTNDKQLAYRLMDGFLYNFNLRKVLQKGDRFSITYEEKYDGNTFIRSGEILRSELEIKGKMHERNFVAFPEGGAFVAPNWNQDKRPLYSPAAYSRFSSLFSYRRRHPVQGRIKPHLGLDFELPMNAPIYAAAAGQILRMGRNRAAGNYIVIKHRNGLESYYNHLSKIHKDIGKGAYVPTGKIIGYNGCTGYCTKPHLHFAVKKRGRWVNPIGLVKSYPYHRRNYIYKQMAANDSADRDRQRR